MTDSDLSPTSFPRPAHDRRKILIIIIAAIVIAAIAAIAVGGYLFRDRLLQRPFQGNLILTFPAPWTAPDKEVLTGLVTFNTAKNTFSNLTIPQQGIEYIYSRGIISPDGTELLVTQMSTTSSALALYSLPLQKVTTVLDSRPAGTRFSSMYWSGNGAQIAYTVSSQSIDQKTLATDGKPFLVLQDGKYTSRPGAQLPSAFQSSGAVVSSDGSHKISLGAVDPGTFSPDGTMLLGLGHKAPGLAIISLADGTQRVLDRPKDGVFPVGNVNFVYDSTGAHLGVLGKTGSLAVYAIDWKDAMLTKAGTTASRPVDAVFGPSGQLLTFEGDSHQATIYSFLTSTSMSRKTYSLILPGGAQLLGWAPAK